uniref:hypothetical protein n=1 Tax=Paenibacillus arenilitoris TaxID=2772299 RepID=UPI0037CAF6F2
MRDCQQISVVVLVHIGIAHKRPARVGDRLTVQLPVVVVHAGILIRHVQPVAG